MAIPTDNIPLKQENYSPQLSPQISSSSSSEYSPIDELIDDVIGEIFSRITYDVLQHFSVRLVCKRWSKLLENNVGTSIRPLALKWLLECKKPLSIGKVAISFNTEAPTNVDSIIFTDKFLSFSSLNCWDNIINFNDYKETKYKTIHLAATSLPPKQFLNDKFHLLSKEGLFLYNPTHNRIDCIYDLSKAHGYSSNRVMAVSENKQIIAFTAEENSIRIYNTQNNASNITKLIDSSQGKECRDITFAGDRVAVVYKKGNRNATFELAVYDLKGNEVKARSLENKPDKIRGEKDFLAVQFCDNDIAVLNPVTLEEKYVLKKDLFPRNSIDNFSIQNGCICTLSGNTFQIFDLYDGKKKMNLHEKDWENPFLLHGDILAKGTYSTDHINDKMVYKLQIWDVNSSTLIDEFDAKGFITKIAINERANGILEIAAGIRGGIVQVWSPRVELTTTLKEMKEKEEREKEVRLNEMEQMNADVVKNRKQEAARIKAMTNAQAIPVQELGRPQISSAIHDFTRDRLQTLSEVFNSGFFNRVFQSKKK